MKILFVTRPDLPIPPPGYGGTERVLASLITGMVEAGHDVILLGHPDSTVPCRVLPAKEPRGRFLAAKRLDLRMVRHRIQTLARQADVVHSVAPLHHLLPLLSARRPLVLHFHSAVTEGQLRLLDRYIRHPDAVRLVTCGRAMLPHSPTPGHRWLAIPNGIPVSRYDFSSEPASPPYLAYLGRITENKGVDLAIRVAAAVGWPLRVAGPLVPLTSRGRYEADVQFQSDVLEPAIRQGTAIYVGELAHGAKMQHLGGATALLHPARQPEPFGLDVAESLACGTPIVALARGEMPYLVTHGRTGFLCSDLESMISAVPRSADLRREDCRRYAEEHLDEAAMVRSFLAIYRELIATSGQPM